MFLEFRIVRFFMNDYLIAGWKGNDTERIGEKEKQRGKMQKGREKNDKMEKNVQNTNSSAFQKNPKFKIFFFFVFPS